MSQEFINSQGEIDIDKLSNASKELFLKRFPKENPMQLDDERAQHFSDLWFSQQKTASVEQKNKVGIAYISKLLALGDEVAKKFVTGDRNAYHAVGMKQSGVPLDTDSSEFWKEIRKIFPGIYNNKDLKFLINEGGAYGVFHFLHQIDPILNERSPVLRKLAINADGYK